MFQCQNQVRKKNVPCMNDRIHAAPCCARGPTRQSKNGYIAGVKPPFSEFECSIKGSHARSSNGVELYCICSGKFNMLRGMDTREGCLRPPAAVILRRG